MKTYKLTDIAEVIVGGTPKTSVAEYWNGDIPWLSVKDFNKVTRYVLDFSHYFRWLFANFRECSLIS